MSGRGTVLLSIQHFGLIDVGLDMWIKAFKQDFTLEVCGGPGEDH